MSKKFTINRQVPKTTRDPVTGKFERASSYEEAPVGNKSANLCPGAGAFKIIRQTTLYSKEEGTSVVKKTARCNIPVCLPWIYDEDDEVWNFKWPGSIEGPSFDFNWFANLDTHEAFAAQVGVQFELEEDVPDPAVFGWFKENIYPDLEVIGMDNPFEPTIITEKNASKYCEAFKNAILGSECAIRLVPYTGTFNLSIPEAQIYDPDGSITEITYNALEDLTGITLYGKMDKMSALSDVYKDLNVIAPVIGVQDDVHQDWTVIIPAAMSPLSDDIYVWADTSLGSLMNGDIWCIDSRNNSAIMDYWDANEDLLDEELEEPPNQPIGELTSYNEDDELICSCVLYALEVDFLAEEVSEGYQPAIGMNKKKLQMAPNSEHNSEDATVGTPFNTNIDDAIIFDPTFDSFDTMESAATPKAVDGNATAKVNTHRKKAIDTLATEDFDN